MTVKLYGKMFLHNVVIRKEIVAGLKKLFDGLYLTVTFHIFTWQPRLSFLR